MTITEYILKEKNRNTEPDIFEYSSTEGEIHGEVLRLYLYISNYAGLEDILMNQRLRVSFPWKTNDITEGLFQGRNSLADATKEYGYICLSATCESPSMWGYYANKGEGYCLVFDFEVSDISGNGEKYEVLDKGFSQNREKIFIERVKYSQKRASEDMGAQALFIKGTEWKHEQEYRILYNLADIIDNCEAAKNQDGAYNYYCKNLTSRITGVIIGANCSSTQKSDLDALIHKANESQNHSMLISVYKSSIHHKHFKLNKPDIATPSVFVDFKDSALTYVPMQRMKFKAEWFGFCAKMANLKKFDNGKFYINKNESKGMHVLLAYDKKEQSCHVFKIYHNDYALNKIQYLKTATPKYRKYLSAVVYNRLEDPQACP